jgi:hypothetical protein
MNCPVCSEGKVVQEILEKEYDTIVVPHIQEYCDCCGTLVQSAENIKINIQKREEIKNK